MESPRRKLQANKGINVDIEPVFALKDIARVETVQFVNAQQFLAILSSSRTSLLREVNC